MNLFLFHKRRLVFCLIAVAAGGLRLGLKIDAVLPGLSPYFSLF